MKKDRDLFSAGELARVQGITRRAILCYEEHSLISGLFTCRYNQKMRKSKNIRTYAFNWVFSEKAKTPFGVLAFQRESYFFVLLAGAGDSRWW